MPIDLSYIGKKLGGVTQSWNQKDVMLYGLGVGCGTEDLKFVYERDLEVLPTFAVIPAFPAMLNLGGAMQVNPAMVLHGEQSIELTAGAIPVEATVTTTPTIKAVYDKVKGAVVVVATESVDDKGKVLFRGQSSIFVRGEGGFDRPILHGLCTFGHAGRAVLASYCGNDPKRMKAFEVRFSGVVYPGETITTDMWEVEKGTIVFTARTERGEALSSAAATVA